jgi:ribose 1,5-bisphosphokinase
MTPQSRPAGRLVYVMGPSGAGKDTLINYARLRVDPAVIVSAHRYITRPTEAGAENHIVLSEAEFIARRDAALFALCWSSHGFWYGIGTEIDSWLARGLVVVVSGSRAALTSAKARYPGLLGIVIDAPIEVRAARLASRRREDEAAIRARLGHDVLLPPDGDLHWLDNSGTIATAGDTLVALLKGALDDRSPPHGT